MFGGGSATSCPTCGSKSYVSPKYTDDSILLGNLQNDWISMQKLELQYRMCNSKMQRSYKNLQAQIEQNLHMLQLNSTGWFFFRSQQSFSNDPSHSRVRKEDMSKLFFFFLTYSAEQKTQVQRMSSSSARTTQTHRKCYPQQLGFDIF